MQLEDYFDFLAPDDIRIKGHRIGIETILYEYLFRERTPEEIQQRFPSLALEQIYATILYYLCHRGQIDTYLRDWLDWSERVREEQSQHAPSWVKRIHSEKAANQPHSLLA